MENQLDEILKNWEQWRVYDSSFVQGLKMTLKIPKDFNPIVFESEEVFSLFQSDYENEGKARAVALDIAKINYKQIQKDHEEGKLNLQTMCYDNGINLQNEELSTQQMLLKLNTLVYMRLVEDFKK